MWRSVRVLRLAPKLAKIAGAAGMNKLAPLTSVPSSVLSETDLWNLGRRGRVLS